MIEVRQTTAFSNWLAGLNDQDAARILVRLQRAEKGSLGDCKFFDGIGEMRFKKGAGYRLYFVQRGPVLIVMLGGGTKRRQNRDIAAAKEAAADLDLDQPK